jgi:hypothetical protein
MRYRIVFVLGWVMTLMWLTSTGYSQWKVADKIEVAWNGAWYPAIVLEMKENKFKIHYDGYDNSWDEWVDQSRIRAVGATQTSGDQTHKRGDPIGKLQTRLKWIKEDLAAPSSSTIMYGPDKIKEAKELMQSIKQEKPSLDVSTYEKELEGYERELTALINESKEKYESKQASNAVVSDQDTISCGSVDKYKQTHFWEDLPGCVGAYKGGTAAWDSRASLLGYAKEHFSKFYKKWTSYRMGDDDVEGLVHECNFFKHSAAANKWVEDKELAKAAMVYQEEAGRVSKAYDDFKNIWKPVLAKIASRYFYCETDVQLVNQKFEEQKGKTVYREMASTERELLRSEIAAIKPFMKEAENAKIPGTMPVYGSGQVKETTLETVRLVLLPRWEGTSSAADQKAREAYEKQLEPYLKLMSGDKAKMFREWYGLKFYGRGGVLLESPQAIANSPVWYSVGYPPCVFCPMWEISGVKFRGMNFESDVARQQGYGDWPPASVFK